jgi:hypothetical protein
MDKETVLAKLHELRAKFQENQIIYERTKANLKPLKVQTEKPPNTVETEIKEDGNIKEHTKETIFLIEWECLGKWTITSCKHTFWLSKNGYRQDPILKNSIPSRKPERPYELAIFNGNDEKAFALYVQLLTKKLLYYKIRDWNSALKMFVENLNQQEFDCELGEDNDNEIG